MPMQAQQIINLNTGIVSDSLFSTTPTRTIQEVEDGVVVTYNFPYAQIVQDKVYPTTSLISINGFGINNTVTEPALLSRYDSFNLPLGTKAKATIVDSAYIELPFILSPARPLLKDNGIETYSTRNIPVISAYGGYFPNSAIWETIQNQYRGNTIERIRICPLQYDYQNKRIRIYNYIKYKITFISDDNNISVSSKAQCAFLRNITLNGERIITKRSGNIQSDYLILTTTKHKSSANYFAMWKRMLGFNTHVIVKNNWTINAVKDTISYMYHNCESLDYLLFIGGYEDVPAYIIDDFRTDLFYGCMDGEIDHMPDICRGRLPVATEEEALTVINKIINYEKSPPIDSNFYMTGLHCAYFQDCESIWEIPDGYSSRRFAQTSEEVREYVMNKGKLVKRIYYTEDNIYPTNWTLEDGGFGEAIPSDLRKPLFPWNGNKQDINDSINSGAFYVLYRGHGLFDRWCAFDYKVSDIDDLNNTNKYPVVFSITCFTGKLDNNNFSQQMLTKKNGGCSAIISATAESDSFSNDKFTLGMFDAIWPGLRIDFSDDIVVNDNIIGEPLYRIGEIMDQGLARINEVNDNNILLTSMLYHCYGDPSMQIYTDTPAPFDELKITRNDMGVNVSTGDTAYISFYNTKNDEVLLYRGVNAYYRGNNDNVVVCISGHNKIPYIDEPQVVYIQDEIVDGSEYDADIIRIGSNVTSDIPSGPVVFQGEKTILRSKFISIEGETTIEKGTEVDFTISN